MENLDVLNKYLITIIALIGLFFILIILDRILKKHGSNIQLKAPMILLYTGTTIFIVHRTLALKLPINLEAVGLIAIAFSIIKLVDVALHDIYLNKKNAKVAMPKLMRNIVISVAYIIAFFGILKSTIGFDIAPLITTSAVVSMVIGLALQDTLTNFIAGLVLHMEKAYKIGDLIRIDSIEGHVVETTWRTTKVRQKGVGIHSIPNSMIVKQPSINYSKIGEHYAVVKFTASMNDKPNRVFEIVMDVVRKNNCVLKEQQPDIRIVQIGAYFIEYELRVWIDDFDNKKFIESDLMKNIWYSFKRNNIVMPFPTNEVINHFADKEEHNEDEMVRVFGKINFFSAFNEETLRNIAKKVKKKIYGKNETLFFQGEKGDSFFIIYKGRVNIMINNEIVATLKKGDFFGEMSLFTGKERTATVETIEDSEFIVLDKEGFGDIIMRDSEIAEHISKVIAEREVENEKLKKINKDETKNSEIGDVKKKKGVILQLIKDFFEI